MCTRVSYGCVLCTAACRGDALLAASTASSLNVSSHAADSNTGIDRGSSSSYLSQQPHSTQPHSTQPRSHSSLSRAAPSLQSLHHSSYESAATAAAERAAQARELQQQQQQQHRSGSSSLPDSTGAAASGTSVSIKQQQSSVPAARALGDVMIGRPSTQVKVTEDAAKRVS